MNENNYQQFQMETENPALYSIMSKMIKDMKFVGIFTIIMGALNCIIIIGAIFGVPMILIGLRYKEAAEDYERYLMTNDYSMIFNGFEKQRRAFFIQKVLIIIMLVLFALEIVFISYLISSGDLFNGNFLHNLQTY